MNRLAVFAFLAMLWLPAPSHAEGARTEASELAQSSKNEANKRPPRSLFRIDRDMARTGKRLQKLKHRKLGVQADVNEADRLRAQASKRRRFGQSRYWAQKVQRKTTILRSLEREIGALEGEVNELREEREQRRSMDERLEGPALPSR